MRFEFKGKKIYVFYELGDIAEPSAWDVQVVLSWTLIDPTGWERLATLLVGRTVVLTSYRGMTTEWKLARTSMIDETKLRYSILKLYLDRKLVP
jgi:hypothetical protein